MTLTTPSGAPPARRSSAVGHIGVSVMVAAAMLMVPAMGHRVLLVPHNVNSHYMMFLRFGEALVAEGHEVVMVVASNNPLLPKLQASAIGVREYQGVGDIPLFSSDRVAKIILRLMLAKTTLEYVRVWEDAKNVIGEDATQECRNLMRNASLRSEMEQSGFDLAVVDPSGLRCDMNYAVSLRLPYALFSISTQTFSFRLPDLGSFVPTRGLTGFSDRMTFMERVRNVGSVLMAWAVIDTRNMLDAAEFPDPEGYNEDLRTIVRNAKFWFLLEDLSLSYPRPTMPNTALIGDLMLPPPGELSPYYRDLLDSSPEGVILVSFGSVIDVAAGDVIENLCGAFRQLPQMIIWKTKLEWPCGSPTGREEESSFERRLKVVDWMPQSDILAHPNLHLFITHGGLNSVLESLYHRKPMIVFPMVTDQPFNANVIQTKAYGHMLDVSDFTTDQVVSSVRSLVGNATVAEALQRGFTILTHKEISVSRRISFWIEHVVNYGDAHLRSAAFDLNVFQFFMVDIYLFAVGMCVLLLVLGLMACCCFTKALRCCYHRLVARSSSKNKTA